jgi:LysM repeat protein
MANGIVSLGSGGSPQVPAVQDDPFLIAQYTAPQAAPILDNPSATPTEGQSTSAPNGGYTNERSFQNSTFNGVMERRGLGSGEIVGEDSNSSQGTGNTPIGGTLSTGNGSSSSLTQNSTSPPAIPAPATAKLQGRDPDLIYVGEKIKLPDGSTYTVKDGDTLSGIAKAHGVSLASLIKLNGFNEQLLDEYKDGKLFKAHHVGDPMPTAPGGATAVPGTPQVPPTTSTTTAPDSANSNSSSNTGVTQQNTGVVNSNQANPAVTSPKELLKNIDRIADAKDRQTLKGLLEILAKHDADPSAPLLSADQSLEWLDLGKKYGENFGLTDASSTSVTVPEPTLPAPVTPPPSNSSSTGMTQQLTA